jgi:hypothetical protein
VATNVTELVVGVPVRPCISERLALVHHDGMQDIVGGVDLCVGLGLDGRDELDMFTGYGGCCWLGLVCFHGDGSDTVFLVLKCPLRWLRSFFEALP